MASTARSTLESFSQTHLLRHFTSANRHLLPLQVKVLECSDLVTVLDNHQVESGSQLVLHGWTRQPKVIATAGLRRFAIPLSYQGLFKVIARSFQGASGLEHSLQKGQKLKVVDAKPDRKDGLLPVREGDVILALGESIQDQEGASYIDCQKVDQHSGRTSDVFISSQWNITFEEILENLPAGGEGGPGLFSIRDFVAMIADRSLDVELVRRGSDHHDPASDLPVKTPINLCKHIVEPAVYASLGTPQTAAFHIPMRVPLYVRFVRQLPKGCSPLLTKQNARVSTFDRCVELLTPEVYQTVISNKRNAMNAFQQQNTSNGVMTLPTAGSRGRRGLGSSQSQVDIREMTSYRKGPMSTTGSLSSKFKWKFSFKKKGSRSTGGSSRGSDFGSVRSLPVTSRKKSPRFQFLMSNGDTLTSGSSKFGHSNRKELMIPPANRRKPPAILPPNQTEESDDEFEIRRIPVVTARLSQRKSTTKKHQLKSTIYEEVAGAEIEEENNTIATNSRLEEAPELSPRVKSTNRTNGKQEGGANTNTNDRKTANQATEREIRTNQIAVSHVKIVQDPSNQGIERTLSPNQSQNSDYDAPRPRSANQRLSAINGNDVTSKGFRRQSSLSSEASDSVSSSNDVASGFRPSRLGPRAGSMQSIASNTSILKTTTSANTHHHSSNHHRQTPVQAQQTTSAANCQIPPGYALVPLNQNQTAIPPGYAIIPTTDGQQKQQQQLSSTKQQQSLSQQRQPNHDNSTQSHRGHSGQNPSEADTLREDERDDDFLSDEVDDDEETLGSVIDSMAYSSDNSRLNIPLDGNLVSLSAKKFSEFLFCLNVDEAVIQSCRKHRIDGKRFSCMTDSDLDKRGLLHPVVLYFRKRTGKRTNFGFPLY